MKDSDLFDPETKKPNWQLVLKFLKREGHLSKQQCIKICKMAMDLFKKEPNLTTI